MTIKSDVIPWAHKIYVGTGYKDTTTPWSIVNPTQNIDLKNFPSGTECFYTLINFTDLRITTPIKLTFIFIKMSTLKEVYSFEYVIPVPTTSWSWYSVCAWIGHFDWEINEPGDYKCRIVAAQGLIFKATAEVIMHVAAGPAATYTLTISTTPANCAVEVSGAGVFNSGPAGGVIIPNLKEGPYTITVSKELYTTQTRSINLTSNMYQGFVLESTAMAPPGFLEWIWNLLINPIIQLITKWFNESVLPIWKLISEKFLGFLDWVLNLAGSVADFIAEKIQGFLTWVTDGLKTFAKWINDIGGNLVNWLRDNIGGFFSWISEKFLGFVKWLGGIVGSIADYIKNAISSAISWVTEGLKNFTRWLSEIGGSIAKYISESISGFVNWTSEQIGSIWKGIETLVGVLIEGLTKSFFQGLNIGINEGGHSPMDTEKETDNQILQGLQKYMIKYRNERDKKKVK